MSDKHETPLPPTLPFAILKVFMWCFGLVLICSDLILSYLCLLYFTTDRMVAIFIGPYLMFIGPAGLLLVGLAFFTKWGMRRREFFTLLLIGCSPLIVVIIFTLAVWTNMLIDPASF